MNEKIENQIIRLLAQSFAVDVVELKAIYSETMSLDKLVNILEITHRSGLSLERARELAKG